MKREMTKSLLTILGAALFNFIFWQEKMAANMLLFDAFILGSVFYLYPDAWRKHGVRALLLAHLITLGAVVVHNTLLSKLACNATLLLLVAFIQYLHRSVWFAIGSAFMNIVLMLVTFIENLPGLKRKGPPGTGLRRVIRFLVIPLVLALIFLGIYAAANAVFRQLLSEAGMAVESWLNYLFTRFSLARFMFLLFGLYITGSLLLKSGVKFFSEKDNQHKDNLYRKRNNFKAWRQSGWFDLLSLFMGRFANGIMALRNELTVGIISLVLLNALLLSINIIDIIYVWLGFSYKSTMNLSAYVHEGAGMLIFSIILAMVVLLFFFRRNLNFYKKNKYLRYGAIIWIVQNIILVISVFIRDYYYFVHMGMAYKRIGVMIFLALVLTGLITVFIKIQFHKTTYYLFRVNAWAAVIMLVICSCVHWDLWIARHNLARKGTIPVDVNFLLNLSDRTLPVIEQNKDVLDTAFLRKMNEVDYIYQARTTPAEYFNMRKKTFFEEQEKYTWLSWNVADAYVKRHLPDPLLSQVNH